MMEIMRPDCEIFLEGLIMRVTGGAACGLRISTLPGRDIRPTSDRVREALFQILSVRLDYHWSGVRVLDLFAGSGALGIEALSRGAAHVVFADSSPRSLECIRDNLGKTGFTDEADLLRIDIRRQKAACRALYDHAPFDLVLADPPYDRNFIPAILRLAMSCPLLHKDGILVIEELRGSEVTASVESPCRGPVLEDIRTYGQTSLYFFRLR